MRPTGRWAIGALASACLAMPVVAAGTITIATVLGQVNPLHAIGYPPYAVHPVQFDGLTERSADGVLAPALALSWRAEAEHNWILELRPNVRFSNGEPLDANAVKATFDFVLGVDGRRLSIYREFASVERVAVRGPLEVEVVTRTPDPMLPFKLVSLKILPPRHFAAVGAEGFDKYPIGTGPFVEVTRTPARAVFKANPAAWRPPRLDRLTLVSLPDATTRVQALAARQVDIALDIAVEHAPIVIDGGGRVIAQPSGSVDVIQFNISKASPLRDPRVRRALNHAIDKDRIVQQLLGGYTRVATQFASRGTSGFDQHLEQPFPYDPVKARGLLQEAGYGDGFDLPIEMMASVATAPFEQAAADLNAVGVRATLTIITVPTYTAHYYQNTWAGLAFYGGYNASPSFDALAPLRLHSCLWPNPWYCDRAIADRVNAIDAIFESDRRETETRAVMAELNADPPAILLYDGFKITGLNARVLGFNAPDGLIRYDTLDTRD
jgi:peptide/nickel transport system substrate-binding protein